MIICDHRESRSTVPSLLEDSGIEITKVTLDVGDYIIQGKEANIIIERKSADDYINSMIDENRLNNQLYHMSTNYEFCILMVEGYLCEAMIDRNVTRKQVWANVASSILKRSPDGKCGVISILFTETIYDTALTLKYLHDRIVRGDTVRLPRLKIERWKPEERALVVLAGFPRVGEVRARRILEHPSLNNLAKVVTADIKTLMEVKGIGETIAKGIVDLSNKRYGGSD